MGAHSTNMFRAVLVPNHDKMDVLFHRPFTNNPSYFDQDCINCFPWSLGTTKKIKDKIKENKKTNKKRVNSLIPPGGVEPPTLREWTTLSSRRVHRILRRLVCLKKRLTIQNYFINTPVVSFKYPEF